MIDLYDSIEVLELPKVIFNKLVKQKVYFIVDLICLKSIQDKDTLNMIFSLKKQLVDIVHSKGLYFIDELPIDKQMELMLLIDEKKKSQKIEYIDDINIEDMGLTDRGINILIQNNIRNLSEIVKMDVYGLRELKSVGEHYCQEIIDKVHSYGILFPNESVKDRKTIIKVKNSNLNEYKKDLEENTSLLRQGIEFKYQLFKQCEEIIKHNKYLETVSDNLDEALSYLLSVLEKNDFAKVEEKEKKVLMHVK